MWFTVITWVKMLRPTDNVKPNPQETYKLETPAYYHHTLLHTDMIQHMKTFLHQPVNCARKYCMRKPVTLYTPAPTHTLHTIVHLYIQLYFHTRLIWFKNSFHRVGSFSLLIESETNQFKHNFTHSSTRPHLLYIDPCNCTSYLFLIYMFFASITKP